MTSFTTKIDYDLESASIIYSAIKEAGIDFVTLLPDSANYLVQEMLANDPEITCLQCSREDEGVAIAVGAQLGGKKPLIIMEGSGLGLSALILARAIVQGTPLLIVASHNSTLGEMNDSHRATRLVTEPLLRSLGIPYTLLTHIQDASMVFRESQLTVQGMGIPVAVLIPRHIVARTGGNRRDGST